MSRTFLLFLTLFLIIYSACERRRRDLNPRAAINDLHPFQGCPFGQLGYFSELKKYSIEDRIRSSGEDGIRTHAPFRTNGFQDRLVMTTSIPLHVVRLSVSALIILANPFKCVNTFFHFFYFFFYTPFFPPSLPLVPEGKTALRFLHKTGKNRFRYCKAAQLKILPTCKA